MNKKFWTIDKNGEHVLRDLSKEEEGWSYDRYLSGELDAYNYMWHEMFNHYVYDDNGCDYERYGCYIREGDVVLDLGDNFAGIESDTNNSVKTEDSKFV